MTLSCLARLLSQWAIVLPKSLVEKQVRFFRFWSNHQLQDGLHYQNELFHRLQTADEADRFRLYRLGHQLVQQGADVLVIHRKNEYSLWVSLRSQPKTLKFLQSQLPSVSFASSEIKSNLRSFHKGMPERGDYSMAGQTSGAAKLANSKRKVIGR